MLSLITVVLSTFFIVLTGWTFTTFVTKDDSQKLIQEELGNMFDITKMLAVSIRSLIQILIKASFLSHSDYSSIGDNSDNVISISDNEIEDNKVA